MVQRGFVKSFKFIRKGFLTFVGQNASVWSQSSKFQAKRNKRRFPLSKKALCKWRLGRLQKKKKKKKTLHRKCLRLILPVKKRRLEDEINQRKAVHHCLNNQNLPGRTYCQVSGQNKKNGRSEFSSLPKNRHTLKDGERKRDKSSAALSASEQPENRLLTPNAVAVQVLSRLLFQSAQARNSLKEETNIRTNVHTN